MAKAPKTLYTCTECGGTVPKWQGKCPHCGEWNTLQEGIAAPEPKNARFQSWAADTTQVQELSKVTAAEVPREPTGMGELDRVLGGGLVDGAVILLGGDPGIGKSTLLLQTVALMAKKRKVLYVSGEESAQQVALRAQRLGLDADGVHLLAEIRLEAVQAALKHAEQLLEDGADILDIGGESTRPGSPAVSLPQELARVLPVLREAVRMGAPVSVDTYKPEVMAAALDAGADIINDVQALEDEGALELLAAHRAGVCLMHMKGQPENMQDNPQYRDVCTEVAAYLRGRADACRQAGIDGGRIVLDPGFGFGKNLQHNIALMRHLPELMAETGFPLLIGVSRKSMIGELTGEANAAERVHGSVAAALASVARGAQIVRVHDVKATADALKVWEALGINL